MSKLQLAKVGAFFLRHSVVFSMEDLVSVSMSCNYYVDDICFTSVVEWHYFICICFKLNCCKEFPIITYFLWSRSPFSFCLMREDVCV